MKHQRLCCALFCGVLLAGFLSCVLWPRRAFSPLENRCLRKAPALTAQNVASGGFSKNFESYATDQFPGRDFWLSAKASAARAAGMAETGGVLFCRGGYLVENTPAFSEETAQKSLNAMADMAKDGYKTAFLFVPSAFEAQKERLPAFAYQNHQARAKRLAADVLDGAGVTFVCPNLAGEGLYYKTDHHLTAAGSFKACQALFAAWGIAPLAKENFTVQIVSQSFYGSSWSKAPLFWQKPDSVLQFIPKVKNRCLVENLDTGQAQEGLYHPAALLQKDQYAFYLGGVGGAKKISTSVKNGRRLFVFADSFALSLAPFLAEHYEEITLVDLRYYNQNPYSLLRESGAGEVLFVYGAQSFLTGEGLNKLWRAKNR